MALNIMTKRWTRNTSFFDENKDCKKFRLGLKFVKSWLGCTRNSHPYNKEINGKIFPNVILQKTVLKPKTKHDFP